MSPACSSTRTERAFLPLEFARLADELAPDVTVRVLAPGESLDLDEAER